MLPTSNPCGTRPRPHAWVGGCRYRHALCNGAQCVTLGETELCPAQAAVLAMRQHAGGAGSCLGRRAGRARGPAAGRARQPGFPAQPAHRGHRRLAEQLQHGGRVGADEQRLIAVHGLAGRPARRGQPRRRARARALGHARRGGHVRGAAAWPGAPGQAGARRLCAPALLAGQTVQGRAVKPPGLDVVVGTLC